MKMYEDMIKMHVSSLGASLGAMVRDKEVVARFTLLFVVGVLLLAPDLSFAFNNMKNGICNVVSAATGGVGKAIATIAIVALGIGAFFGKVTWTLAVMVAIGIAGVFGAKTIVNIFGGNDSGCT